MFQAHHPGHTPPAEEFRHAALFYSGDREFLDAIGGFVRDGIAAGEPTLVVVDAGKIAALRDELGDDADSVLFADMATVGTNPGAIISAWDDFLTENGAEGRRVRGVGEPVHPDRSPDELIECHRHEELLNLAFADAPGFWLVCPYDASRLDPVDVAAARASHPLVIDGGVERHSDAYGGLQAAAEPLYQLLSEVPPTADVLPFDTDALPFVRDLVARYAAAAGMSQTRSDDLLLAVNELATNSVRHASGVGVMSVWLEDSSVICQVSDSGRNDAPLTGRFRPPTGEQSGYGLWMVNQLCDLVQLRVTSTGDGRAAADARRLIVAGRGAA